MVQQSDEGTEGLSERRELSSGRGREEQRRSVGRASGRPFGVGARTSNHSRSGVVARRAGNASGCTYSSRWQQAEDARAPVSRCRQAMGLRNGRGRRAAGAGAGQTSRAGRQAEGREGRDGSAGRWCGGVVVDGATVTTMRWGACGRC